MEGYKIEMNKAINISFLVLSILLTLILIAFITFKIISVIQEKQYKEEVTALLTVTDVDIRGASTDNQIKNAFLPFHIKRQNITKLALINFEQTSESVYNGLELQYLERKDTEGYRILAYRNDGYIDIYDDETLPLNPEEDFNVAGKGAKEHVNTKMTNVRFEKDEQDNVHISFAFYDVLGRPINVTIDEGINSSSTPFNLLAPIGLSSENPEYFPLFWLYDFNFIRTKDLHCEISIDGKDIDPDPFPIFFPIQGQFRNFIRYTFDSRLYSIFDMSQTTLKEVRLNENNQYTPDDIVYQFNSEGELRYIKVDTTYITFVPSLSLMKAQNGTINITTEDGMGYIKGEFSSEQIDSSNVRFKCNFSGGWKANVHLLTHKIVVNDNSIFATWPKQYSYTLDINLDTKKVDGKWENH